MSDTEDPQPKKNLYNRILPYQIRIFIGLLIICLFGLVCAFSGVVCEDNCQNGGVCVSFNVCECPKGYTGRMCQKGLCKYRCKNGGTCIKPDTCKCLPGYTGPQCETGICPEGCLNDGVCIRPSVCYCQEEYTGNRCEIAICREPCQNGGSCETPSLCSCPEDFSGKHCEIRQCGPNGCSNGGTCMENSTCICQANNTGQFCESLICGNLVCQNGGECFENKNCICPEDFTGDTCEITNCGENGCQHGGTCDSPFHCSCFKGYAGSKCEYAICGSEGCKNGGYCIEPEKCDCPPQYTGTYCELEMRPKVVTSPLNVTDALHTCNLAFNTSLYTFENKLSYHEIKSFMIDQDHGLCEEVFLGYRLMLSDIWKSVDGNHSFGILSNMFCEKGNLELPCLEIATLPDDECRGKVRSRDCYENFTCVLCYAMEGSCAEIENFGSCLYVGHTNGSEYQHAKDYCRGSHLSLLFISGGNVFGEVLKVLYAEDHDDCENFIIDGTPDRNYETFEEETLKFDIPVKVDHLATIHYCYGFSYLEQEFVRLNCTKPSCFLCSTPNYAPLPVIEYDDENTLQEEMDSLKEDRNQ